MACLVILSLLLHASVTSAHRDHLASDMSDDQHTENAFQTLTNRLDALGNPSDLHFGFPPPLKEFWGGDDELGMGSFGAVWNATAKAAAKVICPDCEVGKQYAIKVFYRKEAKDRAIALTWAKASPSEKRQLNGVSEECALAKKLANVNGANDKRRKHIMACIGDRVGHRGRKVDDVLYLVLGNGGTGIDKYWKEHGSKRSVDDLKSVMRQSMESLAFLAAPGKGEGFVHHDLKSENMVVRDNSAGGLDVMLIDFGGTLKSDVFSSNTDSVSNINAPPEWDKRAFNSHYPFAFDTFSMANVFIELLTGETLVDIYYRGSLATHTARDRTLWCQSNRIDSDSCEFWHALEVWWRYIQTRDLDSAKIIDLVGHRDSRFPTGIQRHFFDQLLSDQDFLDFLDVIGRMFSHYAGSRPSAEKVLQSAFLTGRSSKRVAQQQLPVKKAVTDMLVVPKKAQAKQPVQELKPGAGFESLGGGMCKNADGKGMSNIIMYRNPDDDEESPFEECRAWCSTDPGCFGYATGMGIGDKYLCRLYTENHEDYFESGYGKQKVQQLRGLGSKWEAPRSYDFDDIEPIQGTVPGGRQSTCFRKVANHQIEEASKTAVVVDDTPYIAEPEAVNKHQPLATFKQLRSHGPSANEAKSLPKFSVKKETVAQHDFVQGQGAFESVGKGMCKSQKNYYMSNIFAETNGNKAEWVKRCEDWCKEDGGCFGYAITEGSSTTLCRLHTKNYADYVETGFGRTKTLQTKGEGGTWRAPGSYDFQDVGEITDIIPMPSGHPTECFRKVQ